MLLEINKILVKFIFALIAISFFIGGSILSYSIILLSLFLIIYAKQSNLFAININKSLLVVFVFFIFHMFGMLYSDMGKKTYFDLEVKLSLFLIPLLLTFTTKAAKLIKIKFFKYYIFSSVLASIFLILKATIAFIATKSISDLFYIKFSYFLHPSYYAMYLLFAIVLALNLYGREKHIRYLLFPILVVNTLAIALCNSKAGYVSALIILIYIVFQLFYKVSRKATYLFIATSIVLGISIYSLSPRFQVMFNILPNYQKIIEQPNTYKESTGIRILTLDASLKIIKENLLLGVGTGNEKNALLKKYEELDYKIPLQKNMNAHNQFIETWIGHGFIGFLLLLLVFIIPFIDSIKRKDKILQAFLILTFVNFLFESMLNTRSGVVFFAVFYGFLVTNNYPKYNKINNQ